MDRAEDRELLRQILVPVILGNGIRAHRLCLRFYFCYGVRSIVCGKRRGLLDILDPACDFFKLYSYDSRLISEELADLSESGGELIMPLFPAESEFMSFVAENEELLESRFIICRGKDTDKHLFSRLGFDLVSER